MWNASVTPILRSCFLAGALVAAGAAGAQTSVSIGSLEHDTSLPVEVTSDNLRVENDKGSALFDGNVVVIQGPMRLAAGAVRVEYGADGEGDISRMVATGGITFANGDDAAEAREAVYNPDAGTLELTGDVILTQKGSAISGQRLVVDLGAGTGQMEGRVRTVFQPGGE